MHRSKLSNALRVGTLSGLALASSAALAQPSAALDRVSLWLGGYYSTTDVTIEARDHTNNDTTGRVDLTSGHENVGRARLDVLIMDSQGLTFDYYSLDHTSTKHLSHPFSYDGIPFELDTSLTGKIDFAAGSLAYHWWFGNDSDVFGVGLGATYYHAKLGIQGTVTLEDISASASTEWNESAVAPLLTFAYKHAFSNNLRAYVNGSGVKKNGGKLSGHLYDARAGVEWFPWENVGFGAEYGASRVRLYRNRQSYSADLDIDLHGPAVFARFRF